MGTPIGFVCLSVHFDLQIHKRTDTLEEMLQSLREHPHLTRPFLEDAGLSSTIRQMMDHLLTISLPANPPAAAVSVQAAL